jgi:hypothetical protein
VSSTSSSVPASLRSRRSETARTSLAVVRLGPEASAVVAARCTGARGADDCEANAQAPARPQTSALHDRRRAGVRLIQQFPRELAGWTAAQPLWHALAMPAPITRLSDRFADYTLRIKCRKCGHERYTDPHVIAKLLGWETPLATAASQMRCSKCQSRGQCDLTATNTPKPRSYRFER